jgi:hypothetical protein
VGAARFTAILQPRGNASAIILNDKQVAAVGEGARRFPVHASINGCAWRTIVTRMRGEFMVGVTRAVREEAGVEIGDTVGVWLELDKDPREVQVPDALAKALAKDSKVRTIFDELAYSHRKEYARWIAEAKREDTRERRVGKALEMLRAGKTRS